MRIDTQRQVGLMVTHARKDKGMTQGDVALRAHVSRQLVNRLEMGDAPGISLTNLLAILSAVGCSLWVEPDDAGEPGSTGVTPEPRNQNPANSHARKQLAQDQLAQKFARLYQLDPTLFEASGGRS